MSVDVHEVRPPRDVLVNVASGVWTANLHYWLRIDSDWYAYVVWSEPQPTGAPAAWHYAVLPARDVRPMTPVPCHVRMYLGWARGHVVAWRRPRGRHWEGRVTLYTGRRNKTAGTEWYPMQEIRLDDPPADQPRWEPTWR